MRNLVASNVTVADHTVLRRLVLLGAPLALAILEIFHPERPSNASGAVERGVAGHGDSHPLTGTRLNC